MPLSEILGIPIKITEITDSALYYKAFSGSQLVFTLFDITQSGEYNMIARGTGVSWNESVQQTPIMEWGQRSCLEIVTGAMQVGQLSVKSMFFMKLNDTLPTYKDLVFDNELKAIVQIAEHERPELKGIVLDVFTGVKITGQSGDWNATSLYLRNAQVMYRQRLTGLEYATLISGKYPAKGESKPADGLSSVKENYIIHN